MYTREGSGTCRKRRAPLIPFRAEGLVAGQKAVKTGTPASIPRLSVQPLALRLSVQGEGGPPGLKEKREWMQAPEACRGSRTKMRCGSGGLWVAPKEAQVNRDPHRGNPGLKMQPARVCSSHCSVGLTPSRIVLVTVHHELLSWGTSSGSGPILELVVVAQSLRRVRLSDPTDRSTPGFPVLQHLPEFAQTHVY